jgi:hypothetical protein
VKIEKLEMGVPETDLLSQLSLPPGFRFYPTDEELLVQYLCRKVAGHHFNLQIIAEIDLYKFDPWILPSKAIFGEKEWYFFSPRDRKYPNGSRPNRVAGSGYWKATGTDKVITTEGRKVGIKKALVFYVGKAPKGTKTNWIMHEYRLLEHSRKNGSSKVTIYKILWLYLCACQVFVICFLIRILYCSWMIGFCVGFIRSTQALRSLQQAFRVWNIAMIHRLRPTWTMCWSRCRRLITNSSLCHAQILLEPSNKTRSSIFRIWVLGISTGRVL